jgi:hypothetical protein
VSLFFEAGYDLAELGGFQVNIVETGGNTFSVTKTTGKYFLRTSGSGATGDFVSKISAYIALLTDLQTALNAGTGSGTYTVTFSLTGVTPGAERVVVSHAGGSVTAFSIAPVTNATLIGLTSTLSGSLSHTMQRTPTYFRNARVGFWTDWSGEYEGGEDIAIDQESHDGTPHGISKMDAPSYLDFTVPLEPVAVVGNYPKQVAVSESWTWRSLWQHARNIWPIVMDDATEAYFLRLRAEGARFRPQTVGGNYIAHWDLPFETRVLARK